MVKCYREVGKPNYSYDILLKNTPIYLKEENIYKSRIPKLYYETAMSLLFLEKFDQAISYFDKCIEFETNKNNKNDVELLSECYYRKGYSLSKMNKKKEAINEFDEAIKYNDKNADIHNYKAHCLMILGNYEQAIESYVASINLNNKKFSTINDGNFSIGYCYTKMNKYEDALKYFEISKNINETEIKNMYLKGIESCEDGKAEESLIKMHLKYKDFSEKLIDLNYYKGICNMELGNYEEAIKNFDSCNKFDKKFCESYYKKGILFSRQNRSNEAIEQFEKAIFYNNKVEEFKEALQKEKEKIEKNDKNDNISNDASTSAINANKESNKIEEKNKMDNDLYKKQESYNIKEKDENVMEEKKEDIKEENDIRKSRTIKQRNSVIFKNKLISKSRNIGEINEERKEHNSTEGNNEIEMLLDESEKQVKKANNDLGVARNESKTFIINDK
jgi:tetratricopeptide (TPR) repeat protein